MHITCPYFHVPPVYEALGVFADVQSFRSASLRSNCRLQFLLLCRGAVAATVAATNY